MERSDQERLTKQLKRAQNQLWAAKRRLAIALAVVVVVLSLVFIVIPVYFAVHPSGNPVTHPVRPVSLSHNATNLLPLFSAHYLVG